MHNKLTISNVDNLNFVTSTLDTTDIHYGSLGKGKDKRGTIVSGFHLVALAEDLIGQYRDQHGLTGNISRISTKFRGFVQPGIPLNYYIRHQEDKALFSFVNGQKTVMASTFYYDRNSDFTISKSSEKVAEYSLHGSTCLDRIDRYKQSIGCSGRLNGTHQLMFHISHFTPAFIELMESKPEYKISENKAYLYISHTIDINNKVILAEVDKISFYLGNRRFSEKVATATLSTFFNDICLYHGLFRFLILDKINLLELIEGEGIQDENRNQIFI
jgi:hypothetical protein